MDPNRRSHRRVVRFVSICIIGVLLSGSTAPVAASPTSSQAVGGGVTAAEADLFDAIIAAAEGAVEGYVAGAVAGAYIGALVGAAQCAIAGGLGGAAAGLVMYLLSAPEGYEVIGKGVGLPKTILD